MPKVGRAGASLALLLALLLVGCSGGGSGFRARQFPLNTLQQAAVQINGQTIRAWVMDTEAKRQEGMMYLTDGEVEADEGMLFVFPDAQPRGFWMRNTLIPLDIAYIGADRRILNIEPMRPLDETSVLSDGPARYALEVRQGTFARLGIEEGMLVSLPPGL